MYTTRGSNSWTLPGRSRDALKTLNRTHSWTLLNASWMPPGRSPDTPNTATVPGRSPDALCRCSRSQGHSRAHQSSNIDQYDIWAYNAPIASRGGTTVHLSSKWRRVGGNSASFKLTFKLICTKSQLSIRRQASCPSAGHRCPRCTLSHNNRHCSG